MKPDAYFFSGAFFGSRGAGRLLLVGLGGLLLRVLLGLGLLLVSLLLVGLLGVLLGLGLLLGSLALSSAFFSGAGAASFFSGAFAGAAWAKHRPVVATTNIMANRIARTFFICCHLLPVCFVVRHFTRTVPEVLL